MKALFRLSFSLFTCKIGNFIQIYGENSLPSTSGKQTVPKYPVTPLLYAPYVVLGFFYCGKEYVT